MSPRNSLRQKLEHLIAMPFEQLTAKQRLLRYLIDVGRYGIQQLRKDRAAEMAAALTYRTIFSLIPVLVLSLLIFRAFGGFEHLDQKARHWAFNYLGLSTLSLEDQDAQPQPVEIAPDDARPEQPSDETETKVADAAEGEGVSRQELAASVETIVSDLTDKASKINFGSIGAVGLLLFIFAAIGLVTTVEDSFNRVYNAPRGRPWHQRIAIYWAVMTLGPFLLVVTLYMAGRSIEWINAHSLPGIGLVLKGLTHFTALGASWLLLFLLFMLMPNAKVRWRPALTGSFIAAVLWEVGKLAFKYYVGYLRESEGTYTVLYGSLALIPLFLFWVYITWLIVLFGLEFAYTLQAIEAGHFRKQEMKKAERPVHDPHVLLPMMALIGQAFAKGEPLTRQNLSQALKLSPDASDDLLRVASENKLVHVIENDGESSSLTLAMPAEKISLERLIEIGHNLASDKYSDAPSQSLELLKKLRENESQQIAGKTLADLL